MKTSYFDMTLETFLIHPTHSCFDSIFLVILFQFFRIVSSKMFVLGANILKSDLYMEENGLISFLPTEGPFSACNLVIIVPSPVHENLVRFSVIINILNFRALCKVLLYLYTFLTFSDGRNPRTWDQQDSLDTSCWDGSYCPLHCL